MGDAGGYVSGDGTCGDGYVIRPIKADDIVKVGIDADELAVTKAESKATPVSAGEEIRDQ